MTTWKIDPMHSDIAFKVKHMMISTVTGFFEKFDGTIDTENENFSGAKINFEAEIDSINTKNEDRDNHLKSDDFFNAGTFPKLTFKSSSFDGSTLAGQLTIRDVTKDVELGVEHLGTAVDGYGQTKAGFEVTGTINRKDFGLNWSAVTEAGNIVVSDKVKLQLDVQFVKQ